MANRLVIHFSWSDPIRIDRPTARRPDTDANPLLIRHGRGGALPFLGGTCPFSAILARVRNCPGVTPTSRLKWRVSLLRSEKPARAANSARKRLARIMHGAPTKETSVDV